MYYVTYIIRANIATILSQSEKKQIYVRWDFCLILLTAVSSALRIALALADTQ